MLLKIIDTVKAETSLVNVGVFEQHEGSKDFFIWDLSGECGRVAATTSVEVTKCLDSLYHNGKAVIYGTLDWDYENEDEEN